MHRLLSDPAGMSPRLRLVRDLLYACMGPVIALGLGALLEGGDISGYPTTTFAVTWFVIGLLIAGLHYFNREPRQR